MASFWFLLVLIISLMIFPLLASSSNQINLHAFIISSSPTLPRNSTPLSSFQELSPDIAPLLPSSGGAVLSPTESPIPTIPSDPSPPNPDALVGPEPNSALSPQGLLASSAAPQNFVSLAFTVLCAGYWSVKLFRA